MVAAYKEAEQRIHDAVQEIHLQLDKFRPLLRDSLARRFGYSIGEEDLTDIVSDTLLWVIEHIYRYNPELSSFPTWLNAKAHHLALEFLRRNPRGIDIEDLADTLATEIEFRSLGVERHANTALDEALSKLTSRRALVIRRHYLEERSVAAIAEELGIRETSVRSLLSRGLKELRQILPDPSLDTREHE